MIGELWDALRGNNTSKVKELVENGADLEGATKRDGWSLLHAAAYTKGNLRMVKLLLNHRADVNARLFVSLSKCKDLYVLPSTDP